MNASSGRRFGISIGQAAVLVIASGSAAVAQPCQREWTRVGLFNNAVNSVVEHDDGSGPALYASGSFSMVDGQTVGAVARWRAGTWSMVGTGISGSGIRLVEYDADGAGPGPAVLCAGGFFSSAGGVPAGNTAVWDGQTWSPMGVGVGPSGVLSMTVFDDDGPGPRPSMVYVGGQFTTAGGQSSPNIAAWNGQAWLPLGDGTVSWGWSIAGYADERSGPGTGSVYVGSLMQFARFNGVSWETVGGNIHGYEPRVYGLGVFDDDGPGPRRAGLYVSGTFTHAGSTPASGIARWDGTSWEPLGQGLLTPGGEGSALAFLPFDDGSGPALYVGGAFTGAGTVAARNVARWNGAVWSSLGGDFAYSVYGLASHDVDGAGPGRADLFVASGCPCNPGFTGSVDRWMCVPCAANCDGSTTPPVLNVQDFACFLNHFASGDPHANCDQSTTPPVLNVMDFSCFLNSFAAGCP